MDIKKAERMAKLLIRKHLHSRGVWEFRFDRARRRFGFCRFNRRRNPPGGVITLSRTLTELNDPEEVRDTILHEIAHALCEPGEWHGEAWRRTVRKIGGVGRRCYDLRTVTVPAPRYIAECPNCGYHRKYDRRRNVSCGECDTAYNPAYRLVFKSNQTAPHAAPHAPSQHHDLPPSSTKGSNHAH